MDLSFVVSAAIFGMSAFATLLQLLSVCLTERYFEEEEEDINDYFEWIPWSRLPNEYRMRLTMAVLVIIICAVQLWGMWSLSSTDDLTYEIYREIMLFTIAFAMAAVASLHSYRYYCFLRAAAFLQSIKEN